MPKHIIRLLLLLIAFLLFAYAAIVYLTDPSFYRFGHYRSDAVPELAAAQPVFKGTAYCQSCHAERHSQWSSGGHVGVKCEVCHGPAGDHPLNGKLPIPQDPVRLCATCHEAMPARPEAQPQVVIAEHPYPHEEPLICTNCHNPHSPGFEAPSSRESVPDVAQDTSTGAGAAPVEPRLKAPAEAANCAGCHGQQGEGMGAFPALAGMEASVFMERMRQFKTGEKPSALMASFSESLNEQQVALLAEYYQSLGQLEQ